MPEPVTTYVLTFKSRVVDDGERRANLNRFLKAALRSYGLRLVNMQTKAPAEKGVRISRHTGGAYADINEVIEDELSRIR